MKVIEQQKTRAGNYVAKFDALVRSGNKVGLKATKGGQKAFFRLKSEKDEEIPCSVPWEPESPRFKATLAVLGVSAEKIAKIAEEDSVETALLEFEKTARAKALPVSVYVREEGGWGGGLKPAGANVYTVIYAGMVKDAEGKLTLKHIEAATKKSPRGGTYESDPWDKFTVIFEIVAGERKGATLTYSLHYSIVKNENDDWIIDASRNNPRGAEFNNFLLLYRIPVDNLNPDRDFEDPSNGLPEIDKMLKKRKVLLSVSTNADGWIDKVDRLPEGVVLAEKQTDEAVEYAASNIADLFSVIDRRTRAEHDKSAWDEDGKLSKYGKTWVKDNLVDFMKEREIPLSFKKMDDTQVNRLLKYIKTLE